MGSGEFGIFGLFFLMSLLISIFQFFLVLTLRLTVIVDGVICKHLCVFFFFQCLPSDNSFNGKPELVYLVIRITLRSRLCVGTRCLISWRIAPPKVTAGGLTVRRIILCGHCVTKLADDVQTRDTRGTVINPVATLFRSPLTFCSRYFSIRSSTGRTAEQTPHLVSAQTSFGKAFLSGC